ncbi:carboxypeptidase-like regulatory domain-containing protein [Mangrovivirga cuniculi]|uniref:TonB C-terminal domain-containing protein n=1 Tax=Mangrovivirga cuniculi TaxID=2715131 RepID=A0A4D7JPV4_9BACT|nr:carboxypeptidase-like regulatory domain-containing protein [Mangrovivirga cuniculi]QCK13476.1 hypothetical protein DCC35_01265 [Mangrovivirga cuniculi]
MLRKILLFKLSIVLVFWLMNPVLTYAQVRKITGRVYNEQTQQPVLNAKVFVEKSLTSAHTNALGYFQLEISYNTKFLWIEHVAFKRSRVSIPEKDKFAVIIEPSISAMPRLDIESNVQLPFQDSLEISPSERGPYADVSYKGGWQEFYTQFEKHVVSDSSFDKRAFDAVLEFTISETAEIMNLEVFPKGIKESEILKRALYKMDSWLPAIQNDMATFQRVSFPVSYGNKNIEPIYFEEAGLTSEMLSLFYDRLIKDIDPPFDLRNRNVSTTVITEFIIQINGEITDVKCSSAHEEFKQNIKNAITSFGGWDLNRYELLPEPIKVYLPFHIIDNSTQNSQQYVEKIPEKYKKGVLINYNISDNSERHNLMNATPRFPGGYEALQRFIEKTRKDFEYDIPPNRTGGNVFVEITINDYGKILDKRILSGLTEKLDREALRIISEMPNWTFSRGKIPPETKVKVRVPFYLESSHFMHNADQLHFRALQKYKKGDIEKAIKLVSKAIDKYPIEIKYYLDRAGMYFEIGDIKKGCTDLNKIKVYDQGALSLYNKHCEKL